MSASVLGALRVAFDRGEQLDPVNEVALGRNVLVSDIYTTSFVVGVVWLASLAWIFFIIPRHWKARGRDEDVYLLIPASDEFRSAMVRAVPVLALVALSMSIGALGVLFEAVGVGIGMLPYALACAGGMLVSFLLILSVVYFNWPKWLVAPYYRDELGLFELRRKKGK